MRTVLEHSPAVHRVQQFEHRLNGTVEQFKAVALLIDGSRLHINEVHLHGRLHKYAYYWLTPTGALIIGWDNAPHHPQIASHPSHQHDDQGVAAAAVRSLADALSEIERRIGV